MNWFGPLPGHREARALSWMAIAVAVLVCAISIIRGFQGQSFMGRPLGGDFVQFYVVGKILNQHEPARMYDLDLEVRLQHEAVPSLAQDQMLVFASAPYIAPVYRPLALVSYPWAYVAWLIFSMALYSTGAWLMLHSVKLTADQRKTGFLLAISCMPFLMESWIGGQTSAIGFFAIALFVFCRARGWKFLAGLGLALALFKPTLIAIPVLMLLCGRRWRVLAGVASGAMALGAVSIATVGMKGCLAWVDTLKFYGHLATGSAAALRRVKYIDFGSLFHLALGSSSMLAQVAAALVAITGIAILGVAWWRSSSWKEDARDLLWAATLAGALVCNVYTPIYDSIMAGPAIVLAVGVLFRREKRTRETFVGWLVLLYMVPWLTQSFAEFLRIQPFTLVLAGFAWWMLREAKSEATGRQDVDLALSQTAVYGRPKPVGRPESLGATSYAVCSSTSNSTPCLSVLLRSYSLFADSTMGTR